MNETYIYTYIYPEKHHDSPVTDNCDGAYFFSFLSCLLSIGVSAALLVHWLA